MRRASRTAAVVVLGLLATGVAVRADEDGRRSEVVARVGSAEITVGALEQRLRAVPDFQLAALGATPEERKRRFLDEVIVPETLFAEAAKARKLDQTSPARERIDDALRVARLELLKTEIRIPPEEVAAFYAQNRGRFDAPERIAVFRILCSSREDAAAVIAEAKQSGTLLRWNELARERSLDKATALRGGNLGFVAADGSSSEASVRVDPALFGAASHAKDGEIVGEPVKEGDGFAVVWRRGSMPAVHRGLEEEAPAIRQVLGRKRLEDGARDLLKELRAAHHVEEQAQLIDLVEVDSSGVVSQRRRPGTVPRRSSMPPAPSATPRGLR